MGCCNSKDEQERKYNINLSTKNIGIRQSKLFQYDKEINMTNKTIDDFTNDRSGSVFKNAIQSYDNCITFNNLEEARVIKQSKDGLNPSRSSPYLMKRDCKTSRVINSFDLEENSPKHLRRNSMLSRKYSMKGGKQFKKSNSIHTDKIMQTPSTGIRDKYKSKKTASLHSRHSNHSSEASDRKNFKKINHKIAPNRNSNSNIPVARKITTENTFLREQYQSNSIKSNQSSFILEKENTSYTENTFTSRFDHKINTKIAVHKYSHLFGDVTTNANGKSTKNIINQSGTDYKGDMTNIKNRNVNDSQNITVNNSFKISFDN